MGPAAGPARRQALLDLIEHGTGAAAYYADVMDSLVSLAVGARRGPRRARPTSWPGSIRTGWPRRTGPAGSRPTWP